MSKAGEEEEGNPGPSKVSTKFCDERHKGLERLLDEKMKSNRNWIIGLMAATAFWLSVLQLFLAGNFG